MSDTSTTATSSRPAWATDAVLVSMLASPLLGVASRAISVLDDGPGGSRRRGASRAVRDLVVRTCSPSRNAANAGPADRARTAALDEADVLLARLDLHLATSSPPTPGAVAALRAAADPKALGVAAMMRLRGSDRATDDAVREVARTSRALAFLVAFATADRGDVGALSDLVAVLEDRHDERAEYRTEADVVSAIREGLGRPPWIDVVAEVPVVAESAK